MQTAKPQNTTTAAQPRDWRAATREDIVEAYEILRRHHPGMFDPYNPGFPEQLRRARDAALAFVPRVHDDEGHMLAIALFSSKLADPHARIAVDYNGRGQTLWPGFKTVWRGDALHVVSPVDRGPPQGSILIGCDGKSASRVVSEALASQGLPAGTGEWQQLSPLTFLRGRSQYEPLPRQCSFRGLDGHQSAYLLDWEPVTEAFVSRWFGPESKPEPIGMTEPRSGIYLISLPTFRPDAKGRSRYATLFAEVDQKIATIASGRAVVIDLRQNHGGSSSWSEELAGKLWGEAAVKDRLAQYFRRTQIWWLADKENIAHWQEAASDARSKGNDGIEYTRLVSKLELALKEGKHFYVEDFGASLAAGATGTRPRHLPPVYVIIDGGCVSACLDALDVFTRFDGVKLVGAPTSADSNYMDIRFEPLPSGRGAVVLPTKIWVNRPRRAGEIYRPDIPVSDLDLSTATMLDHVERDLPRH